MSNSQISKTIDQISLGADEKHKKIIQLPDALIPYRLALCSYGAAMVSTTVGFPLDSVKTRLQTHKFHSAWQCFIDTERHEGIRGFYRGLTAPLLSSSAVRSISVTVYSYSIPYWSKVWFSLYNAPKGKTNLLSTIDWMLRTSPITFCSGALAGSVCSVVSCPFEFTKLASQIEVLVQRNIRIAASEANSAASSVKSSSKLLNGDVKSKGTLKIAKELIQKGGLLSLYGGYRYHLCKCYPHGIQGLR